ncbi:MAG TPA: hypothetical protein VMV05_00710 [bacterium]|nr:hypothetical protein [bacterium]
MSSSKKKSLLPKSLQFLIAYCLGFLSWVAGLHCLEGDSGTGLRVIPDKLLKHSLKVLLGTVELILLCWLFNWYRGWLAQATVSEVTMAFLVKSTVFLYFRIFWPGIFPLVLPGVHPFFCPQCYRKQVFRFLPVSLRFGYFVTYLCRHCSCLVDGWGRQVFYPLRVTLGNILAVLPKTILPSGLALGMGVWLGTEILRLFN